MLKQILLLISLVTAPVVSLNAATISNDATGSDVFSFGIPDTQTYGQVFTAPTSGVLSSFSLSLNGGLGTVAGGVGNWNGPAAYAEGFGPTSILYMSPSTPSTTNETFTFMPNITVSENSRYVIFLTVSGLNGVTGTTSMPLGTDVPGFDYFVWNNGALSANGNWNYFSNYGGVLASVTINPVPLPAALPLFGLALGGLGFYGRRRKV